MIMVNGIEIDVISLIPALFAVFLSLYNYYKMSRPADITPNELINYGLISSSFHESYKCILPLMFHNSSSKEGLIKDIKIGFNILGEIKYLDITGKAKLSELVDESSDWTDWDKFTKHGYKIIQPTYPISIPDNYSEAIVIIATASYDDNIFPVDQEAECLIEVSFGKNKRKQIHFPFYISESQIPDNSVSWFRPVEKIT